MKKMGKIKKVIAILIICCCAISSSFSIDSNASDVALDGNSISMMLEAFRSIFNGIGLGRAGYSAGMNKEHLYTALSSVEDMQFHSIEQVYDYLLITPEEFENLHIDVSDYEDWLVSKAFTEEQYSTYCAAKGLDEDNPNALATYVDDLGLGEYLPPVEVNGKPNWVLRNSALNKYAQEIIANADAINAQMEENALMNVEYPLYPEFYTYGGNGNVTLSLQRILANRNIPRVGNLRTYNFSTQQSILSPSFISALNEFEYFDLISNPFVITSNQNLIRIIRVFDNSFITFSESRKICKIFDYDSFIYKYAKAYYNSDLIFNDNISYNSIPFPSETYQRTAYFDDNFPLEFGIYEYDLNNTSQGWREYTSFSNQYRVSLPSIYCDYYISLGNEIYFNFNLLNKIIGINLSEDGAASKLESFVYTPGAYVSYFLFNGVGVQTGSSPGIEVVGEEESGTPIIPGVILADGAEIVIPGDFDTINEINSTYSEENLSEATSITFNQTLADVVSALEDQLYRTSTIYKLLQVVSGSVSSISSVVSSIGNWASSFFSELSLTIGTYLTDAETGENFLTHLLPIDDIAEGVLDLPGYFVDSETDEPFAAKTAAGVAGVVGALGVEEGSESIAELLTLVNTGITDVADDYTEEREKENAIPLAMADALDRDILLNNRSTRSVNNLLILPLMFIFILILVLYLMLKALAFVALIFRTPASTAFLNVNMLQGLGWLKNTYITNGGGSLDMVNGSGVAQSGLFSNISIWSLLMFCVNLVALFGILRVVKKWADRQHGD